MCSEPKELSLRDPPFTARQLQLSSPPPGLVAVAVSLLSIVCPFLAYILLSDEVVSLGTLKSSPAKGRVARKQQEKCRSPLAKILPPSLSGPYYCPSQALVLDNGREGNKNCWLFCLICRDYLIITK